LAVSKASGAPAAGIDTPLDAEPHLRAVLERQPVVLTRIGKDGIFLAINQAGLAMLGAQTLDQVLGVSLLTLVPDDERKACQAFLERIARGDRGSFEVDLVGLTGTRHTVELHGNVHPGAPDGIASGLITFRDITESRRLEQSLLDAAARQAERDAAHEAERSRLLAELDAARRSQSDQFSADEQLTALEGQLAELHEERSRLLAEHADEIARLHESLSEERRRSDEYSGSAARLEVNDRQLRDLQERYDAIDSERQQLLDMAGLLRSEAEARQQTVHELTDRLATIEAEHRQALDTSSALRTDLEERHGLVASLTSRLQQIEGDHQQTTEALNQLQRELDSRNALANELAGRIEHLEAEQAALHETADENLRALQDQYATDTEALRTALNDAMAEQARLAEVIRVSEEDSAEKAGRIAALEQAHASHIEELEVRYAAQLSDLESAQARTTAEAESSQAAQAARIAELESIHAMQIAELEAGHTARMAETEATLSQASARADDALAAIQRAEEAFGAERQRLEESLEAALDAERAARDALSAESATRESAERSHRQLMQAMERFAIDAGLSTAAFGRATAARMTARALVDRLTAELPRRLGPDLPMSLLAANTDGAVLVDEQATIAAIGAFAESRREMAGGEVVVEFADVFIDEEVGRTRAMSPGAFLLVGMNVTGPGAHLGFPSDVFDTAESRGWREVAYGLDAARRTIVDAGGQVWLMREGGSLIVEFYLPREASR
jgi:PAS domain S-box-containing protein